MTQTNFERMLQLADDVFSSKTDPHQLDISESVLDYLRKIHPASVSGQDEENGPVAWVLVIPTTTQLMNQFLDGKISEKELYHLTPLNKPYDVVYLCSAMVLEEHRRKGIAKKVTLQAIEAIRQDHNIKTLFAWTFTPEGLLATESIARAAGLALKLRNK